MFFNSFIPHIGLIDIFSLLSAEMERLYFVFPCIDPLWISLHAFWSHLAPCALASTLCPCNLPTPKQNQI